MAWDYKDKEFIKIYRKLTNWEWYTNINTKVLFIHCLIRANWRPGRWHGYKYDRGQFFASLPTLANETGLTIRQVRVALNHLKATGEVTDSICGKFRLITVVSFDKYQGKRQDLRQDNDTDNDRIVTDKRQDDDSRYKNNKELYPTDIEEKEEPAPAPDGGADGYGDAPPEWSDWWEKDFMDNIADNPGMTRSAWYDFVKPILERQSREKDSEDEAE